MKLRHPETRLEEIEGCGHAPSLMNEAQAELVRDFLEPRIHWRHEDAAVAPARAAG
jgi:hypothetical protein